MTIITDAQIIHPPHQKHKKTNKQLYGEKKTKKQNYYMMRDFWDTLYKNCGQWSSGFPEVVGGTAVLDE